MREHITEPLWIKKVQISKGSIIIVQQDTIIMQERCGLFKRKEIGLPHYSQNQNYFRSFLFLFFPVQFCELY